METALAVALVSFTAGVFIWWAWKEGAYFGTVFLPGAILLYAVLILLLIGSPFNARLAGAPRVALIAIVALSAWTLLSITWTDSHDAAVQDAERAMLYSALFALGLWCCNLAGRRLLLPLAGIAVTGAVIGIVITVTLAGGHNVASYVHDDATLRFPIGYRNAEAAFLMICFWPTIVLAAESKLGWQLRALLIGSATMLLELVFLAESRGSLPAAAIALTVFLALSPRRLRAAVYLALAALPVLPAIPVLLDVFQHGHPAGLLPFLRHAALAIALTTLASVVLAAICLRGVEPRLHLGRRRVQLISRVAAALAIGVVVIGGSVFMAKRGGPIKFIDQRASEFGKVGYPNLHSQGTRFGANIGSNRHDFWRVSLDQAKHHPILGGGAGSFAIAYLQHRRSSESPKDPHSVEMLMLSELGIVGMALLVAFLVACLIAALRTRRLGRSAAALAAGSLTAAAYWLVHASYDWFWHYPAITAPAIFLLGAAAAPPLLDRGVDTVRSRKRWIAVAALALSLLMAVPLFLSQRYANRAYDEARSDPGAAISDLNHAADLDPYDPAPLLAKGLIESNLGQDSAAAATLRSAIDRQPDSYAGHFFLARALEHSNPPAALAEAREALRLDPLDPQTRALNRRLQSSAGGNSSKNGRK